MTAVADRQVRDLRGPRRAAALRAIDELEGQGCAAAGYRLRGAELDHVCCRHLYATDRLLTVWPDDNRVIVILVASHDRGPSDVYDQLLNALGIDMPTGERTKPSCCDPAGEPPASSDLASSMVAAVERSARRRRGR